MKSNQLTDKRLRGLSLLSNCKWPTLLSLLSSPCHLPAFRLSLCIHPSLFFIFFPEMFALELSWTLVRSTWSYLISDKQKKKKAANEILRTSRRFSAINRERCHDCVGLPQGLHLVFFLFCFCFLLQIRSHSSPSPFSPPFPHPSPLWASSIQLSPVHVMCAPRLRWLFFFLHESHVLWSVRQICARPTLPPHPRLCVSFKSMMRSCVLQAAPARPSALPRVTASALERSLTSATFVAPPQVPSICCDVLHHCIFVLCPCHGIQLLPAEVASQGINGSVLLGGFFVCVCVFCFFSMSFFTPLLHLLFSEFNQHRIIGWCMV